jgi:hypothetical protein
VTTHGATSHFPDATTVLVAPLNSVVIRTSNVQSVLVLPSRLLHVGVVQAWLSSAGHYSQWCAEASPLLRMPCVMALAGSIAKLGLAAEVRERAATSRRRSAVFE